MGRAGFETWLGEKGKWFGTLPPFYLAERKEYGSRGVTVTVGCGGEASTNSSIFEAELCGSNPVMTKTMTRPPCEQGTLVLCRRGQLARKVGTGMPEVTRLERTDSRTAMRSPVSWEVAVKSGRRIARSWFSRTQSAVFSMSRQDARSRPRRFMSLTAPGPLHHDTHRGTMCATLLSASICAIAADAYHFSPAVHTTVSATCS